MSVVAALLCLAQSGAPSVAEAPVRNAVAERATASVRILKPARIEVFEKRLAPKLGEAIQSRDVQRKRDALGTVWVEFS